MQLSGEVQVPLDEQTVGSDEDFVKHTGREQFNPDQEEVHPHVFPLIQLPFGYEQLFLKSHVGMLQFVPFHPSKHVQLFTPIHKPLPLQELTPKQFETSHLIPVIPSPLQTQISGFVHLPFPVQTVDIVALIPKHIGTEQLDPVHPLLQLQELGPTHVPFPVQNPLS